MWGFGEKEGSIEVIHEEMVAHSSCIVLDTETLCEGAKERYVLNPYLFHSREDVVGPFGSSSLLSSKVEDVLWAS